MSHDGGQTDRSCVGGQSITPRRRVLVALVQRRWNIPILAELARREGAKFSTLAHAMGAPSGSIRASLDDLIRDGWVVPNPGYGHPLRPEYILTDSGRRIASTCRRVDETLGALQVQDLCLRRWSLPVLDSIVGGAARFGEISGGLGRITDRALSLSLNDLRMAALIERVVPALARPTPVYLGTAAGLRIASDLSGL